MALERLDAEAGGLAIETSGREIGIETGGLRIEAAALSAPLEQELSSLARGVSGEVRARMLKTFSRAELFSLQVISSQR